MKTKDKINKLFENLGVWIEFPKYQAERRLDVFFGLYLEDILKECRPCEFAKGDRLVLIPEFPLQKNDINNECTNIDYIVFNVSKLCMHAIELKTDNHSVDDEQIAYYHKFEKIDVEKLFDFIIKTKRTGMVMVVGVSQKDRVSTLLGKLPQEEVLLVYSIWDGYYKDPNQVKASPKYKDFRDMFHNVVDIHTAGHADRQTITKVIETVSPKDVICIHKEADASL